MRISDVQAIVLSEPTADLARMSWDGTQDDVVIRVTTDTGLVGIGEVDSAPEVVKAAVDTVGSHNAAWGLRELLLGEDPLHLGPLWERMYRGSMYYGRSGAGMNAMSGVEIALWDILGQATGVPVHVLLGGRFRSSARAYASLLALPEPDDTAALVAEAAAQGFTALKLGGGPLGEDADHDEALVAAARAAAPGIDLMIDLAYAWSSSGHALRMSRRLERYGLAWIEEPLAPDDVSAYVWLTERSPVPIAAGEAESSERGLLELVHRRAVDVLQPDVTRCGGFGVTHRVASAAFAAGLDCVLHCWKTGINKAAALHVTAALPHMDLMEYCLAANALQRDLTVERFPLVDGRVAVPQAAGLGVTLDPETVARHRVEEKRRPAGVVTGDGAAGTG
jgi:L-alanine-DL-glutamate epimerase-like enolase superfamily enzyme